MKKILVLLIVVLLVISGCARSRNSGDSHVEIQGTQTERAATVTVKGNGGKLSVQNEFTSEVVPSGIAGRHTPLVAVMAAFFLMTVALFIGLRRRRRGEA